MDFINLLQQNSAVFYSLIIFISLAFGSFLNVVIYRLPRMMEQEWHSQCRELLELPANKPEKISLAFPASACPQCGHKIRFWENIPVFSYIFLKGQCSGCGNKISLQYPLIEAVTAILSVAVAWKFGVSWQTPLALLLTWSLIALTMIDFHKQLLPDSITLPLLWLGLLANIFEIFTTLESAVIGAMAGYLALWCVYHTFKLLTGKEGMGFGDFKLLGALGAWLGWKILPLIILLSSLVGAVIGIALIVLTRHDKNIPIPFGPYL
ncbi:MAG: Leader peptidase (Prepilin peptidase) / N-methyltransferase, partial [Pseudomonadota bacterium]|nr:Leader peptidase (Prepilin peptidase) / N-methyltransferase [Pseudomonadota bacterium]